MRGGQGFLSKRSQRKRLQKQRQGRQGATQSSRSCDFAAHYVKDNLAYFIDLFGEDWTFDNVCENHPSGCCADDEDCKCFGIIDEMNEEEQIPPTCFPMSHVRQNMEPPQFCMRRPQRGRRNQN